MRNLGLSKLLQTIGRAVRIYKPDPSLKKQAWISVPVINGNEDDKEQVKKYVNAIRDAGYDISAETVYESGINRHEPDSVEVKDAYDKYQPNFSKHFVTEVFHEIEVAEWMINLQKAESIQSVFQLMTTR